MLYVEEERETNRTLTVLLVVLIVLAVVFAIGYFAWYAPPRETVVVPQQSQPPIVAPGPQGPPWAAMPTRRAPAHTAAGQ